MQSASAMIDRPGPSEAFPNRFNLALRGVFWSVINALVPTIAGLLVFVLTARLLSPADFGVVAIASALTAAASALVPAGFGDALVQRMERDPVCLDSVFWLCTSVGVTLYAILAATAADASRLFHVPALATIIPVIGLRVVFETAGVVPTALVTQTLSFHLLALRTAVATVVSAAISVGLVLNGFGLWALVASLLANSCVAALAMFWSTGWWPRLQFSAGHLVIISGYGAYASGTRLVNFIGGQADQALVGLLSWHITAWVLQLCPSYFCDPHRCHQWRTKLRCSSSVRRDPE